MESALKSGQIRMKNSKCARRMPATIAANGRLFPASSLVASPSQRRAERAQALIEIAHPKFREELYEYCERTKWLQRPQLKEPVTTR